MEDVIKSVPGKLARPHRNERGAPLGPLKMGSKMEKPKRSRRADSLGAKVIRIARNQPLKGAFYLESGW